MISSDKPAVMNLIFGNTRFLMINIWFFCKTGRYFGVSFDLWAHKKYDHQVAVAHSERSFGSLGTWFWWVYIFHNTVFSETTGQDHNLEENFMGKEKWRIGFILYFLSCTLQMDHLWGKKLWKRDLEAFSDLGILYF